MKSAETKTTFLLPMQARRHSKLMNDELKLMDYVDGGFNYESFFYDVTEALEKVADDRYAEVDLTSKYVAYAFHWGVGNSDTSVDVKFIIDFDGYRFDGERLSGSTQISVEVVVSTAFDDMDIPREDIAEFVDKHHSAIWDTIDIELDNRGLPFDVNYRDDLELQLPTLKTTMNIAHIAQRLWTFMRQKLDDYEVLAERMDSDIY